MVLSPRLAAITAAITPLFVLPVAADSWDLAGKVRAGVEQQSNVNISQLQQASGRADVARLLEAELNASWQLSSAWRLSGGYSLQDKDYQQAADFNSRLHLSYLDAAYQRGQTTFGTNLYYAQATVANARLLSLTQASVYALQAINEHWFIRPSLTLGNKSFDQFSERDASTRKLKTDSFWFFNDGQAFISLGLQYEQERSADAAFRFQAPGAQLSLSNQFTLWQWQQQLQLTAQFSQRHYAQGVTVDNPESANPVDRSLLARNQAGQTAASRRDNHSQLSARWQLTLHQQLALLAAIEHGNFSSPLPSADYRETRSSVAVQLSF